MDAQEGPPTSAVSQDAPATEWIEEHHADGSLRSRTQAVRVDGALVPDGRHESFHENGQPAVVGQYSGGQMSGAWRAWYPDGTPRIEGEFRDGRRSGRWQLRHANGQLAGVGSYLLGCRDRRWVYFDAEGVKDERESGLYRMHKEVHENRNLRLRCETLGGVLHGEWSSWWPNGVPAAHGRFEHGHRVGDWVFRFQDGSREPGPPSGVYVDGVLSSDAPPPARDPFVFDEELTAADEPAPDVTALPRARRAPGLKSAERERIRTWIGRHLESDDGERRKAELLLVQFGRDALPDLLEVLRTADLETPAGRELARGLHDRVLREIVPRRAPAWPVADDGGRRPLDEARAILRWHAFWELARENEGFWRRLDKSGAPSLLTPELYDGSEPGSVEELAPPPGDEREARLFEARRAARPQRKLRRSVDAALAWLARHQSPDGSFGAVAFTRQCDAPENGVCGGLGNPDHDVGLTALATLAFLADGHTHLQGEHAATVARALTWLRSRQDPETGLVGPRSSHEFLYGHALATQVLAELVQASTDPELQAALESAVRVILAARNPQSAWRYDWPPIGDDDTSVTSWMVSALAAAEGAGIPIEDDVRAGVLRWLVSATEAESGRIGYDAQGAWSARIVNVNDHYPSDAGEAMTGAGLHALYLLGETPASFPEFARSVELLAAKPPLWSEDGLTNDHYYWLHGANALRQVGGKHEDRWREALETALFGAQHEDGELAGSWDPNGPWGSIGGRIYSTAACTLALQAAWREPRAQGGR